MKKIIKLLIIIMILTFSTTVYAKTYGVVDNVEECSYDACFTDLDEALTDGESETSMVNITIESSQSDFKIESHEFTAKVVIKPKNNNVYTIDGEGATLKTTQAFFISSSRGTNYNLYNVNFISNASVTTTFMCKVRRNDYSGGLIRAKSLTEYAGVVLTNPKKVENVSSTIIGEFERNREALFISNDYFLDADNNIIQTTVDLNNVTTRNSSITGIALVGGIYNLNNYDSDFNISIHSLYNAIVNVHNSTIRSLISSQEGVINYHSEDDKWYGNKKLFFLNKIINEVQNDISDETVSYIVEHDEYNYIITDEGIINIKDYVEEKIDIKEKKEISINKLFPYLANVDLSEEEWTSSNPEVANIVNGVVYINSIGETILSTTPRDTQTVLDYKLIVAEMPESDDNNVFEGDESNTNNPITSDNIWGIMTILILSFGLVMLFKKQNEQ